MSWNLVKDKDSGAASTLIHAYNRKLNTGAFHTARHLELTFANHADGAVTIREAASEQTPAARNVTTAERIREALKAGPLLRSQLKSQLGDIDPKTIDTTVRRLVAAKRLTEDAADNRLSLSDAEVNQC